MRQGANNMDAPRQVAESDEIYIFGDILVSSFDFLGYLFFPSFGFGFRY